MNENGRFIVFEGIDLSGKTTVASLVSEWLTSNKIDTILTRHPGSTMIGAELRKIIKESSSSIDEATEALIMAADNSAFISQILAPSLKSGAWVIGDRNNFISSMAYQIASGCSFDQLDKVHAATAGNPPLIDLLFIFRISPETYMQRMKQRPTKAKRDNFENRGNEYTNKVISAYETLLDEQSPRLLKFVKPVSEYKVNTPRCLYIDADKPVNDVFNECKKAICSMMPELCQK